MPIPNLTPEILAAALQGLEAQRARLDAQIDEIKRMVGTRSAKPAVKAEVPKAKRRLSAAGRRRIIEATRKRWAEYHRKKAEAAKLVAKKGAAKRPRKAVATTGGAAA